MKKTLLAMFFVFIASAAVNAQSFEGKGKSDLSVGLTSGFNSL